MALWNVVPRPWNDWSGGAAWIASCWSSQESWLQSQGGPQHLHGIFTLLGVTCFSLVADSLHIMELGVSHRVLGNVLFHLVITRAFFTAARAEDRLDQLWDLVKEEYGRLGTAARSRVPNLTMNMFSAAKGRSTNQPTLTTRVKAAETRHLVPVMFAIFSRLRRVRNAEDGHIMEVLKNLNSYYTTLTEQRQLVTLARGAQQRLERSLWDLNRHYSALQSWALQEGFVRWGVTIKFHMALHIALQSRYTNPTLTWTYMDEDFMSIVKEVGEACTHGTPGHLLVPKVLKRYIMGIDVRMNFAIDLDAMD